MLIPKGLLYSARTFSNKTALIDGDVTFTFAEFAGRTSKLKNSLTQFGVKKGDRIACLMLNDFRYLELLYGITALGGIIVPLNTRLSVEELSFILNDSGAEVLYIHEEFLPVLPELQKAVKGIRKVILVINENDHHTELPNYETILKGQVDVPFSYNNLNEDEVAALYYTGGTTGRPKGVMLTHKNLVANAYQGLVRYLWDENDIYLHSAPMFHLADGGQSLSLTLAGAAHTFVRSFNVKEVLQAYQEVKVTACQLVPTMINMVLNSPEFDDYNISSLRKIIYGASPISLELLKKGLMKMPNVQFIQGYGMTESSSLLTLLEGKDHRVDGTDQEMKRLSSCGQTVQMVEMKVVDVNGQEVPVGEIGEFVAKGPNIMKGYWNLPEETSKALRDGWYFTGDMGYKDEDNYYYILDRAKDMIITGGENVYSVEVERVIYQLPEVLECAVIGIPDEKWGEAIKAVIVLKTESSLAEEEIITFVRKKLANYKVPKYIDFIDELPKSGAGKILKRELRDKYWNVQGRSVH